MGSSRAFWLESEAQLTLLSQSLFYDPAWTLEPTSSKFNLLQETKLLAEMHTHTQTHTSKASISNAK